MNAQVAYFFSCLLLLCGGASSPADSQSRPPLNPKNVGDQPHHLAIVADDTGDGTLRFSVSIRAKDPKVPLEVEWGYLAVYDGERSISGCRVQSLPDKGRVGFEFVVAPAYLEKSRFSFSVATANPEERKKLPSGGGWANYEFTLGAFAGAARTGTAEKKDSDKR